MRSIVYILVLVAFLTPSLDFGQDTTANKDDWQLFSDKGNLSFDTSKLLKPQSLDYSKPDGVVAINHDNRIVGIGAQLKAQPYFYGYTLQLEVSQQKSVIKNARYKILKVKPDIELDDPYEAPNIYLYAGRFYDRVSAYQFKNEIAKYFPNAIVVGPRRMDLPRIPAPEIPEIENDSVVAPQGLEGGMGQ